MYDSVSFENGTEFYPEQKFTNTTIWGRTETIEDIKKLIPFLNIYYLAPFRSAGILIDSGTSTCVMYTKIVEKYFSKFLFDKTFDTKALNRLTSGSLNVKF